MTWIDITSSLLAHEVMHVWQYEKKGWSYMSDAKVAEYFGDGYKYIRALEAGTPFAQMNPEQQDQMIQDATAAASSTRRARSSS